MANFAGNFLGTFDKAAQYSENHLIVFREASTFFKKYLQLEEESNKTLQKLCRATLEASRTNETGTMLQGWEKMLVALEVLAKDRAEAFAKASITVVNPINDHRKNLETSLKTLKNECEKFSKDLQAYSGAENKARSKYQTVSAEWEAAILSLEKEVSNHRKSSNFTKLQDKIDTLAKKTSQAKSELISSISLVNENQKVYYGTHIPNLLKKSEELTGFMGQTIASSLKSFGETLVEIDARSAQVSSDIVDQATKINFLGDMKHFVQYQGNPNFQPPAPVQFEEIPMAVDVRKVIDESKPAGFRREDPAPAVPKPTSPSISPTPEASIRSLVSPTNIPTDDSPAPNGLPLNGPPHLPPNGLPPRSYSINVGGSSVRAPPPPIKSPAPSLNRAPTVSVNPSIPNTSSSNSLSIPTPKSPLSPRQSPLPPPQRPALPNSPKPVRKHASFAQVKVAKALYNCESINPDELSFREGEILEIVENTGPWWKARNVGGKQGLVPGNYFDQPYYASEVEGSGSNEGVESSMSAPSLASPNFPAAEPEIAYVPKSVSNNSLNFHSNSTTQPQVSYTSPNLSFNTNPIKVNPSPSNPSTQSGNSKIEVDDTVPKIVKRCIEYLLKGDNLQTEGILRVPGNLREMKEYKTAFERGGDFDLSVCRDPLTVAGLLKLYFRESPNFPISKDFSRRVVDISNIPDVEERIGSYGALLADLEPARFQTLYSLFQLFIEIVRYESQNKMNPNNLSKVFGLSLFHDMPPNTANGIVEFWVLHFSNIFTPASYPSFI